MPAQQLTIGTRGHVKRRMIVREVEPTVGTGQINYTCPGCFLLPSLELSPSSVGPVPPAVCLGGGQGSWEEPTGCRDPQCENHPDQKCWGSALPH